MVKNIAQQNNVHCVCTYKCTSHVNGLNVEKRILNNMRKPSFQDNIGGRKYPSYYSMFRQLVACI